MGAKAIKLVRRAILVQKNALIVAFSNRKLKALLLITTEGPRVECKQPFFPF